MSISFRLLEIKFLYLYQVFHTCRNDGFLIETFILLMTIDSLIQIDIAI